MGGILVTHLHLLYYQFCYGHSVLHHIIVFRDLIET